MRKGSLHLSSLLERSSKLTSFPLLASEVKCWTTSVLPGQARTAEAICQTRHHCHPLPH